VAPVPQGGCLPGRRPQNSSVCISLDGVIHHCPASAPGCLTLVAGSNRTTWRGEGKPALSPRVMALKGPIVTTWKKTSSWSQGHPQSPSGEKQERFAQGLQWRPWSQVTVLFHLLVVGVMGAYYCQATYHTPPLHQCPLSYSRRSHKGGLRLPPCRCGNSLRVLFCIPMNTAEA
jgi:hypothetical protein